MAITMTPMTAAALSSVPVDKAGVGSGMLNTFRQVGGSLGIAVMGAILASGSNAALSGGATQQDAFIDGLHNALYVCRVDCVRWSIDGIRHGEEPRRIPDGRRGRADRSGMSEGRAERLPAARAADGDRLCRDRGLRVRQLRGLDDRRDRARGRRLRADHLPALRIEARSLVRLPRPRLARAPDAIEMKVGMARDRVRAVGRRRRPSSRPGRARCSRTSGCRGSPRRARTRRSGHMSAAHVREVHDYVAELMRRNQATGGIPVDRDPDAEAWIFLAGGLLRSFADRLGGVLGPCGVRRDRSRAATVALRRTPGRTDDRLRPARPSPRDAQQPERRPSRPRERPTAGACARRRVPRRQPPGSGSPLRPGRPGVTGVTSAANTAIGTKWRNLIQKSGRSVRRARPA